MTNHVPSLDLCKRLKEAGYPQESEFWWYPEVNEIVHGSHVDGPSIADVKTGTAIAAPLATELLERLPDATHLYRGNDDFWYCTSIPSDVQKHFVEKTPCDALAEMWLWLKENNYL